MIEKLKQFFARPGTREQAIEIPGPEVIEEVTRPRGLAPLISKEDVEAISHYVIPKIDYAKIRRTMQLFDIRWINEQFESFIPDEQQIAVFATELAVRTLKNGRIIGPCVLRDRSFLASYGYGLKGEVLALEYILTGANNLD